MKIYTAAIVLSSILVTQVNKINAQNVRQSPVHWSVTHQENGTSNEVEVTAKMDAGFHIWAFNAGGDGSLINTEIKLDSTGVTWIDGWKAKETAKDAKFDFMDGTVHFFEQEVHFVRHYKSKSFVGKFKGVVSFQTCNEEMCYPPQDEQISE